MPPSASTPVRNKRRTKQWLCLRVTKEEFDFNWGPYLSEGKNTVYIKVDNNFGEVKTSNPVEINAIFIQLDIVNFDDLAVKTGDSWPLDVRIIGTDANIYISIDGNLIINAHQSVGSTVTYNITEGLTSGTHILEAYAVSDINTSSTTTISYSSLGLAFLKKPPPGLGT